MNLDLGCGRTRTTLNVITLDHTEWKHVDVCAAYQPDECYDFSAGIREHDASIGRIWMGDVLEHVPRARCAAVLRECHRVLVSRGELLVCVPDMRAVMTRWLAADGQDEARPPESWLIWGEQDESGGGANAIADAHRNGFTEGTLEAALRGAGFENVERVVIHGGSCWYELSMRAIKG